MTDCARFSKQIPFKEIAGLLAIGASTTGVVYDAPSASAWADYIDPASLRRHRVWFDTPGTLAVKMAALRQVGVRGVGFWDSGSLQYEDSGRNGSGSATSQTQEMWDAITAFT